MLRRSLGMLAAGMLAAACDGSPGAVDVGGGEARFGLYVMNADGSEKRGIVPFDAAASVGK